MTLVFFEEQYVISRWSYRVRERTLRPNWLEVPSIQTTRFLGPTRSGFDAALISFISDFVFSNAALNCLILSFACLSAAPMSVFDSLEEVLSSCVPSDAPHEP